MINNPDFKKALYFCLDHEGRGYEHVVGDTGGPTRAGITWRDYNAWLITNGHKPLEHPTDLKDVPKEEFEAGVDDLYFFHYWIPVRGDNFEWPINLALFDFAVNAGVFQSVKTLQRTLGVTVDGWIGVNTLAASKLYIAKHGSKQLLQALADRRLNFYKGLVTRSPSQIQFYKGWSNRVEDLRKLALSDPARLT